MGAVKPPLIALALAGLMAAGASAADKHAQVADLRYGESLYHYYVGDYPEALAQLMVAEAEGGIEGHEHYPELMGAGMHLAFGMRRSAEVAFKQLLGQGEPAVVQDTAHYYLAKLHYLDGDYGATRRNLSALGNSLAPRFSEDAALLKVHLLIRDERAPSLSETETLLAPLAKNRALALYNLGNAASRAGDPVRAQRYYQAVLDYLPEDDQNLDELLAIRDKSATALGYSFLGQRDYASAKAAFRDVRRDTALANQALLGYGWAAASYHDYVLALKPWQVLRQRSLMDTAVLQSLVAVPWAYEQLKSPGAALAAYRESEALLQAEHTHIARLLREMNADTLLATLKGEATSTTLTSGNAGLRQNWLSLDRVEVLHTSRDHLQTLLARTDFQADAQALSDLSQLARRFSDWQSRLEIYRTLVEDKQSARQKRAQYLADSALLTQHTAIATDSLREAGQLDRITRTQDVMALADANSQKLWQRVERSRRHLDALNGAGRDTREQTQKLRLLAGILQWQASEDFPDQRWQAQKQLTALAASDQANARASARIQTLMNTHEDLQRELGRIDNLSATTGAHLAELNRAIDTEARRVAGRLSDALLAHHQQVQDYLARTRLAIAQLYDKAQQAGEAP